MNNDFISEEIWVPQTKQIFPRIYILQIDEGNVKMVSNWLLLLRGFKYFSASLTSTGERFSVIGTTLLPQPKILKWDSAGVSAFKALNILF